LVDKTSDEDKIQDVAQSWHIGEERNQRLQGF